MRNPFISAALAAALAGSATVPLAAHAQNVQQLLQGLTTGNQRQDDALRDAFERGYQKGRQDEAQLARRSNRSDDRGYRNDDRGRDPAPYDPRDNGYRR